MSKSSNLRNRHERQQLNLKKQRAQARAAWLEGIESTKERMQEPEPLVATSTIEEQMPELTEPSNGELQQAVIERAKSTLESKQPRFTSTDPQSFFLSVYRWVKDIGLQEPDPRQGTRMYDEWLRSFAMREPYLAGVLNSVIQIDKNRGWSLTGGRNQVRRYTEILHASDNGAGWRTYMSWQASSYYTTRLGFVTELGREGKNGPLRALWSVDPARCELTGNTDAPLKYFPRVGNTGQAQEWAPEDFFRAASLPSTDEADLGRGYPAVARLLDLAKIMVAVYEYDKEQLGTRAPRGLMLLNGITQDQWEIAMQAREENLDAYERQYYGGVAVLASSGSDEVKANLVALSQLPKDFDVKVFTDMLLYGYALAFGYDAREFWPVSSGSLGTAKETDIQHRKASSKGEMDFSLAHGELLQKQLPPAILFEYETRDVAGETADVELAFKKAQTITEMTKWLINTTTSVLTSDQIIQLAAQAGLVPEEWTPLEETVSITDTDESNVRDWAMNNPHVRRAIEQFPSEPIVKYRFPSGITRVLARSGEELLQRRSFPVDLESIERTIASVARKFHADLRNLAVMGMTGDQSILAAVRSTVKSAIEDAYIAGLKEGGVDLANMSEDDALMIIQLNTEQQDHVTDFVRAIRESKTDRAAQRDILDNRINLWTASVEAAGAAGLASAKSNEMVHFAGPDGQESCKDCQKFKQEAHRRKWFLSKNFLPGKPGSALACGGWQCEHFLEPVG